jgi:EpsI family protein
MNAARIRAVVVLMLMVSAFVGASAWRPTQHLADLHGQVDLESIFPRQFADWRIDDRVPVQLISPDVQAKLSELYNQTLSRTYVNRSGERIMLSVAYGGDQSDGTRAHLPEVCYPAQGFSIEGKQVAVLSTPAHDIRVRRMVGRLGSRLEPITYWLVIGDRVATSGTEMKLAQLRYSSVGVIPDGMLVRVSSIDNDPAKAYALQGSFVAAMVASVPKAASVRVIGSSGF